MKFSHAFVEDTCAYYSFESWSFSILSVGLLAEVPPYLRESSRMFMDCCLPVLGCPVVMSVFLFLILFLLSWHCQKKKKKKVDTDSLFFPSLLSCWLNSRELWVNFGCLQLTYHSLKNHLLEGLKTKKRVKKERRNPMHFPNPVNPLNR